MLDFVKICTRSPKKGVIEIYPKFKVKKSNDLMIRGGDFYAIWIEDKGLWSTDEEDAINLIDNEIEKFSEDYISNHDGDVHILYMWDSDSGVIDKWHKYCQKQMRDNYHMLDEKIIFSNDGTNKKDYASKRLNYPLEKGDISGYETLMSTLYSPEERHKIEWAIGSIVSGDSVKIQKFLVFYGAAGTGKSTVLNIIQQLFEGYYSVFDARALGSSSNSFALEAFKTNPLVAIQHDGDLSRIEDNTRLNSLVSHELMTINEKFKSTYANRFKAFLFMGTNKPVKITDGRSGLIRRLIDVSPSGEKLKPREYKKAVKQVEFELGHIAYHCKEVYLEEPGFYDDYMPITMLGATNDFYNFVEESFSIFANEDGTTLKAAWEMYKTYCDDAKVPYPLSRRTFKEELRNYFREVLDRYTLDDGTRVRNYFLGFRKEKIEGYILENVTPSNDAITGLVLDKTKSIFDELCGDCYAQYANENETPQKGWTKIKTKLKELDTTKIHYVRVPENHIVIDFDLTDANGNKSQELNLIEAAKWPPTYAEFSKSGCGVHLHYIYNGDVDKLSRVYDEKIEVKVFKGKSSLRRKLTKCNDLPIATISSGLPLKGDKNVINFEGVKSEKGLRTLIKRNLNKEYHPATKPSVDFIFKILEDSYNSGMKYDVTDMRNAVLAFAAGSTHNDTYCVKLVNKMRFKSDDPSENVLNIEKEIAFYDVEVFPNLFLVNFKVQGPDRPVIRLINPKPSEIEQLMGYRLIGFNCRRYDNHMLYARLMGYSCEQLYKLSQKIIEGSRDAFFGEAYNISYTDVYDFSSKKQSLKKWEIELGIHHQELGLPWDQPVDESLWVKVAEYCDNDVIATEAVFDHLNSDFLARQILADLAGGTVNDTTNSLTTKLIFGNDRKPQSTFEYRDMGMVNSNDVVYSGFDEYTRFDKSNGKPLFPGYEFDMGKSTYRGELVGEGGYVYSEPGMYGNVALLDIASMHPSSIIAEHLFGDYTETFEQLVQARLCAKHQDWDKGSKLLNGKLVPYISRIEDGEFSAKDLAQSLKIAINSVYGLTSASFINPFRDVRNKDNIVAKRGALFMINLKHEVQARGFTVAHIKTDSIKIPDATPEIIQFVMTYGKMYGYTFEHEATYDRMCLVNDAVYIAKYDSGKWTATGTQFQIPYVFKTLFSREPISFEDMCETKSVSKGDLYLDMIEDPSKPDLTFVGRVGSFCPIKPGCGGGVLYRVANDKRYAATGTKGYLWLESEVVRELGKESDIDRSYYDNLVSNAADDISKYCDFEWFVSDDPYIPPHYDNEGRPIYVDSDREGLYE